MKNNIFNKMIESNKKFWLKKNISDDANGYLLHETFYNEPAMIYGISKTALSIANIKKLKPLCIESLRSNEENNKLVHSMNNTTVGNKKNFLKECLKNSFYILKYFLTINRKKDLLKLKIEKYEIGKYIYDSILISFKMPEINNMTYSIRKRILLEICYFYFFKNLIKNYNIKMMILGDNVYRYGLLFELAKYNNIECITPISLNTYSMKLYKEKKDFNVHYRKTSKDDIAFLLNKKNTLLIDKYFYRRFNGKLDRHDVKNTFSENKITYNKQEILNKYNIKNNKPLVIIMAHVFCDAPHGNPGLLYSDYYEWISNTIKHLKRNKEINFLIKEHPSAELYNEKGLVSKILKKFDCEHLEIQEDVHNLTILNEFDIVITCGGTIGLEFAYKNKPVLLAAKPPYSELGFTIEPKTKAEYENLLISGIEKLIKYKVENKEDLYKFIYRDFILMDNYDDSLELGGQQSHFGKKFNYDKFYNKILEYNDIPLEDQKIYKMLKIFIESNNKHLIKDINV